jgi:hypothetical protein
MAKKKAKKTPVKGPVKQTDPRFVFTGDPIGGDDPLTTNFRGYTFELNGRAVNVIDPDVVMKLKNHSHFKEV